MIQLRITMVMVLSLLFIPGCSVYMAAHQPDKKDVGLFAVGTPKNLLISEFGNPTATTTKDGKTVDIFSFVQGYSTGAKVGRGLAHGAADVLTLGLWEVVCTPTESAFDGDKMVYQVTYNDDDIVENVVVLKRK